MEWILRIELAVSYRAGKPSLRELHRNSDSLAASAAVLTILHSESELEPRACAP
jgi:hypothetical protein